MLKRMTLVLIGSLFLASCAAPKKKPGTGPEGGVETGSMSPVISNQEMSFAPETETAGLHTVFFEFDSATLSAETRKTLADNADWLKRNANATVQIEGHCDSRGSVEYNLALGERRALAVRSYLVSLGIDVTRLPVLSMGEEKPIAMGDSDDAYAKNRRAHFVPVGTKLPGQAAL